MSEDLTPWQKYKQNLGDARPWDLVNPTVPKSSNELQEKRMSICSSCPELIKLTKQCKKCGCFMHAKTKIENATCPLGKW